MRFLSDTEKLEYMRSKRDQCLVRSLDNYNENWFASILLTNGIKHKRQAIWGFRIYDFWIHRLGCAIEVDGPEHDIKYDRYRDIYNYLRSGIVVVRVRNNNIEDANKAVALIKSLSLWKTRRRELKIEGKGIHPVDLTNPFDKYWES